MPNLSVWHVIQYVVKGGSHGFSKGEESEDEIVERVADFFDSQFKQETKKPGTGG